MTTRWPIAAAVAPLAAKRDSRTVTESPAAASASAHAAPTTPAPTTIASVGMSSEPVPEGIARVEVERRPARHERAALDPRHQRPVALLEPAREEAPGDRLLA